MNKEEKQLLLNDLCARLPYGIMCRIDHDPEGEYDIGIDDERFIDDHNYQGTGHLGYSQHETRIILPKGSIEKLIARKMTWKNKPIKIR